MNRYLQKGMCIFLASIITTGIVTGCSKDNKQTNDISSSKTSESSKTANAYPIKTDYTMKVWCALNSNLPGIVSDLGETPLGKELEKKTGVKVTYIHPSQGQERDQFNIMVSSGDIPDIIEYNWAGEYPGGPEKAIKDGLILPLNDAFEKYSPNLKKMLTADKELEKQIKTDNGNFYNYPMIRVSSTARVFRGPIIRKDWLDDLGMALPVTIDDWYKTLKAFKEKKGADSPFVTTYNQNSGSTSVVNNSGMAIYDAFIGAYKTSDGFYVDDSGKVKYGPIEKQYKEFLTTFRKWHAEGLIDKEFALADSKAVDSKMLGDKAGATVGLLSGAIGKYMDNMKTKNPKFNLVGTTYPVLKEGETAFAGQSDDLYNPKASSAITKSCKNVEVAARWLDYAYSEEGNLVYNFGVEGKSYTMVNGYPKVSDYIMKNPDGKPYTVMQPQFMKLNGAFAVDPRASEQTLAYPQMTEASDRWSKTEAKKHNLPSCITPTPEESKELAGLSSTISSYVAQMYVKFVMGAEPLDNFDKYVDEMKKMGIEKAIKIRQDSYDRYKKR